MGQKAENCFGVAWDPRDELCQCCLEAGTCVCAALQFEPLVLTKKTTARRPAYVDYDPNPFRDDAHRAAFTLIYQCCFRCRKPQRVSAIESSGMAFVCNVLLQNVSATGVTSGLCVLDAETLKYYGDEELIYLENSQYWVRPTVFMKAYRSASRRLAAAGQ